MAKKKPLPFPPPEETVTRDELIRKHMPLAKSIATSMKRRYPPFICLDDLIQEANRGLIEAADRYKPETKVPFSAYARRRIAGAVADSIRRRNFKHTATLQLSQFPDRMNSWRTVDTIEDREREMDMRKRRRRIVEAIRGLTDPLEKRMLSLRYFHACEMCDRKECLTCPRGGMTGKAAGKVIGITEHGSSQVHRQAVASLTRALKSAPHFDEFKKAA